MDILNTRAIFKLQDTFGGSKVRHILLTRDIQGERWCIRKNPKLFLGHYVLNNAQRNDNSDQNQILSVYHC